jgi:uncharacterized protein YkwD
MNRYLFSLVFFVLTVSFSCNKDKNNNDDDRANAKKMLQFINQHRAAGCDCGTAGVFPAANPLRISDTLNIAAKNHCDDMVHNKFFDHKGSDGSQPWDRVKALEYNWKFIGENIGLGYKTEEEAIQGWMASPPHCSNIMNKNYKEMGVARNGNYWTLIFATR